MRRMTNLGGAFVGLAILAICMIGSGAIGDDDPKADSPTSLNRTQPLPGQPNPSGTAPVPGVLNPNLTQPLPPPPIAGTPIGLPGPPHLPLGGPAGVGQHPSPSLVADAASHRRAEELIQLYRKAKREGKLSQPQLQGLRDRVRESLKSAMVQEHRQRVERVESARRRLDAVEKQLQRRLSSLERLVDQQLARRIEDSPWPAAQPAAAQNPVAQQTDDASKHWPPRHLNVRWQFKADEAIESAPAVAVDCDSVFVADILGTLYAIDRAEGRELWRRSFGTEFVASPTVQGDLLVIGDVDGVIHGLNSHTGKQLWKASTGGEIGAAAAFHNDHVLATSEDGNLYCLASRDGSTIWVYGTADQLRCSPAVVGDRVFLGACDQTLHIVDLNTGRAIGAPLPLAGPTGCTPVVRDSRVVVPVMEGVVHCIDWVEGKEIWKYTDSDQPQEYLSAAAVSDRLVIIASAGSRVDAISMETGQRVWRHTLRSGSNAAPVIDGDTVWIASTDGRLTPLSLADGEQHRGSHEFRGSFLAPPVISDQDLFIANDEGAVICLSARPAVPWNGRHFVRLVIDSDQVTFQGKSATDDQLPELLEKTPNRMYTVFEFAFASADFPEDKKTAAIDRCLKLSHEFGFEYPSYIGVKPLGSLGSPSQNRTIRGNESRH